jgi:uroporphyrinogen-III decarboxylase
MAPFLSSLALPEVATALEALAKAAKMQLSWSGKVIGNIKRMAALGFPPIPFGGDGVEAPFDYMSDTLRGMRGIFLDMRRSPEKLLAAEEKVSQIQVEYAIALSKATGRKTAFFPLHRGSDGFISLPMFERFYWPQLKDMMLQLIDAGITPHVFYEGNWDKRLEYLAELPKGKTVGKFQQSNIFKVKEVLGDTMCILGGMSVSMLLGSEPSQIREHTHKVCQEVGRGGGFIMTTDISDMEGCNPELIKVWVDATKEFGKD